MRVIDYSGAGNTFSLIDNREGAITPEEISQLFQISDVDGVILLEKSLTADAYMRIFNRDGSEAEMCANGLRCFIKFLKELGIEKESYRIRTLAGIHTAWVDDTDVCIQISPCKGLRLNISANLHFINTGVPHVVKFVDSVDVIDVFSEGKNIRYSPLFSPEGANVNFVSVHKEGFLMIRTYERGVERETLACGTGAIAAALIAHALHYLPSPIDVWVRSGDVLKVSFDTFWTSVVLQGPAERTQEWDFKFKQETHIMSSS